MLPTYTVPHWIEDIYLELEALKGHTPTHEQWMSMVRKVCITSQPEKNLNDVCKLIKNLEARQDQRRSESARLKRLAEDDRIRLGYLRGMIMQFMKTKKISVMELQLFRLQIDAAGRLSIT